MSYFTRIDIERPGSDGLSNEVWGFTILDAKVVLDTYARQTRPTKRHKFRPEAIYSRLQRRESDLTEDRVPLPDGLLDEALEKARAQMTVGLWKRDFGRR